MTEYANKIVNVLIKYGISKSTALKFSETIGNVDFEEVMARAAKLSNSEYFRSELANMVYENKTEKWLDEHMD